MIRSTINYAAHDHSLHVYYVDLKDNFLFYGFADF